MKGTWRGGSFAGDPEGYVEEGPGDRHLSLGTPLGKLEGGSFTRDFEMDETGVSLRRDPLGDRGRGIHLLGTLRIR